NNNADRLSKLASDALREYEQFVGDGFQFVVFVFGNDENHKTFASLRSFSTNLAAASSGVPVRISTRLLRSGISTSLTSYIAPVRPTSLSARPRSAAVHALSSFFFAAMMPFSEA